tara:strand:+ start:400 stop:1335 length:936 start_codon:yes stop_codon:yes gene_type:complete
MKKEKKILVLGSNGLVGNALKRSEYFNSHFLIHYSTRDEADLTDIEQVRRVFKNIDPDIIINCAGKVGGILANSIEKFDFLYENLKITLNIFEMIKRKKNITLINFGSSAIYPKNAPNPLKEEYLMTGELEPSNSSYSLSKIVGIELAKNINKEGVNIVNLIPSNLYGPSDNFDFLKSHVVPGLVAKLHNAKINNDKDYTVWGSGTPLREFLFVDDLVTAIELIIKKNITKFDVINIGSGEEISIRMLSEAVKAVVGFSGDLIFDDSKPDGINRKVLDSSIIRSHAWLPSYDLKLGLQKTYDWYILNNGNE